jgi:hypothetical protein
MPVPTHQPPQHQPGGVFEIYPAADPDRVRFRWRFRDRARGITLVSGCGFTTRTDAERDAALIRDSARNSVIRDAAVTPVPADDEPADTELAGT